MDKPSPSGDNQQPIIKKKRRITAFNPHSFLSTASGDNIAARLDQVSRGRRTAKVPKIVSNSITKGLNSILKRRSSSRRRSQSWIRRISRKYKILEAQPRRRKVRVNSKKNKLHSITPLTGKPEGFARMPDYYVKLPDDGKPRRINFKMPDLNWPVENSEEISKKPARFIEDAHAKQYISVWSSEERQWYESARKKRDSHENIASISWAEAFRPLTSQEFLCNTRQFSNLRGWFESWRKRIAAKQEAAKNEKSVKPKKKRRKKVTSSDEEDDDIDEWKNTEREELPNPYIIHGACGTGKTSLVYCIAELLGFQVVEWSTGERRNGKTLSRKLSGLIESHNFSRQSMDGANIKAMFAAMNAKANVPLLKTRSKKQMKEYSMLLLDDCDIIYAKDDGFWSTLKSFSEESKVPIVLTCTDYNRCKVELERFEFENTHTEHLNRCEVQIASKYLRATLFGWASAYLEKKYIYNLLQANKCDLRKTINELQYSVLSGNLELAPKPSPSRELPDKSFFSTSESQDLFADSQVAKVENLTLSPDQNSEFSLIVDLPKKPVTWRATIYEDLNFVPQFTLSELPPRGVEDTSPLYSMLKEFVEEHRDTKIVHLSNQTVHEAIKDARLRSVGQRQIYAWRDVALDYLPCLSAIHEAFRNRPKYMNQRRMQHPFDVVDTRRGTMIDATGNLKLSISTYPFPVDEQGLKVE